MLRKLVQIFSILASGAGIGLCVYLTMQAKAAMRELDSKPRVELEDHSNSEDEEGHGTGENGASHAAAGGHGEADASGHGAPAADAHGAPAHGAASSGDEDVVSLLGMDEIFVNVMEDSGQAHSLAIKIDLELFNDKYKTKLEQLQPGIKDIIIQTAREQDFIELKTLAGKLQFKETLVTRINEYVNKGVVRGAHFSSFYLQ